MLVSFRLDLVVCTHGCQAHIPYDGKEHRLSTYQVLVCTTPDYWVMINIPNTSDLDR